MRSNAPQSECAYVMTDFEMRSPLERWLLNWTTDSNGYARYGSIRVAESPTHWLCTWTDAETGKPRTADIPRRGVPPPPAR